jgi:hypothetical protein
MSVEKHTPSSGPLPQRFNFVTGTDIREANAGREDVYRPWEAPGLAGRYNDPEVGAHQQDVDRMIEAIIKKGLPEKTTPPTIIEFVNAHFFSKDMLLDMANKEGYRKREMKNPETELPTNELEEIHQRVLKGTATALEIDIHRAAIKRASAELAQLRTVDNLRTEYEPLMIDEIMPLMGDNAKLSGPQKLEIVGYDKAFYQGEEMSSFFLKYKREFQGDRPDDINVKLRHGLVVRTDPASGFNQEIAQAMMRSARHAIEEGLSIDFSLELRRVKQVVDEIADTGSAHPNVAASIISAYEVDPERTAS